MDKKIKMAIVGYGNLGKACERVALFDESVESIGIFSRRKGVESPFGTEVFLQEEIFDFAPDVVLLCVGSQSDLENTAFKIAEKFNTVDCFDTHAKMAKYADRVSKIAIEKDRLCYIGVGWDPGIFSLVRALFAGIMPNVTPQTFWGNGVSQGHSEAIRRIEGVSMAKQYTVPKIKALELAREGKGDNLTDRDKHLRECFVVAKEGADKEKIEREIKNMPNYFEGYDTVVRFVDEKYFNENCGGMQHGGIVLANDVSCGFESRAEFSLNLQSNPHFTAMTLVAYAKANVRAYSRGDRGVKSAPDIAIGDLTDGEWIDKIKRFV